MEDATYSSTIDVSEDDLDDHLNGLLDDTGVYPKVSELAAWSEYCKWYSSLPLGAVVSLFCESV
jgi:hypothetical protein